jgi:hypothetical protein
MKGKAEPVKSNTPKMPMKDMEDKGKKMKMESKSVNTHYDHTKSCTMKGC